MVTIHACAKTLLERAVNLSCVCACMCKLTKGGGRSTYFTGAVYCVMLYSGKLWQGFKFGDLANLNRICGISMIGVPGIVLHCTVLY